MRKIKSFSYSFLLHIILLICFITYIKGNKKNLETKRILIIILPGAHSHNFVFQNLTDYTISHEDKYNYEYHIISHKIDSEIWEKKIKSNNTSYKLYTYGDISSYKETFEKGVEDMNNNPSFGLSGFNNAIILNYRHFLESDILTQLRKIQNEYRKKYNADYYHMIATDVPNFIHKLLYQELKIKLCLYLQPALIPQIYYTNFEMNTAYMPTIGSFYSDEMTFIERLSNSLTQFFTKIIFYIFRMYQSQTINSYSDEYNFDIDNSHFVPDAIHLIQYPLGLTFPFSIPPNFILLGSITSKPPQEIKDEKLNNFLNSHKKNIYWSKGTIMKEIFELNDIIEIFKYLKKKDIGIVLSIRRELIKDNEIKLLPENVYVSRWLDQNNILGDKRINLFVTHGGFNSVLESIYHGKPMVVMSIGLDHINVASFIKKRNLGEVFHKKILINKEVIINSINNVLNKKEYHENVQKMGKMLKDLKNPREEFKYWIDFGFNNGYQSLEIPSYKYKYSWIIVNGYDVALVWVLIIIIIIIIIKKIINCIHDCLCGKCENKHKNKRHYKFD